MIQEVMDTHSKLPYIDDIKLAPPEFIWPEGLPESFEYKLEDGSAGTAFPYPADVALQLYGLWCDYVPGESQRRLDAAYAQLDALREETEGALGYSPPDIIAVDGWKTWEVALLIAGAAILTAGVTFSLGYWAGVVRD